MKLDELYDRYGERMYHYLSLRLSSAEDAEDVLQEAFCRLARYSVRWAFIRNPRAFIFKVLRNESNRYLAGRIRQRAGKLMNPERQIQTVAVIEAPDGSPSAMVSAALARLPDKQKDIVILKVFQGFTFKEIAGICGLSVNTAASRYRYAIEKLRSLMEGKE